MSIETDPMEALEDFLLDEIIDEVVTLVRPGKEGVVYLTRKCGDPPSLFAAKVYRDLQHRSFRNDSVYRRGRSTLDERLDRAMARGTRTGAQARFGLWIAQERAALQALHSAGADVPRFVASSGTAILMEFIGDEDGPAPMLHDVRLPAPEGRQALEQVIANLELFLDVGLVHADLSPYNILYWQDTIKIIDFPQAVDLYISGRANGDALRLLARDVTNVCDFFSRRGVPVSTEEVLDRLRPLLPVEALRRSQWS